MRELYVSGRIVDLVLGFVVEVIVLTVRRWLTGRGLGAVDLAAQLLAGVMLLGAVRCALVGADWRWTAAFLTASAPAHLFDLVRRARRS